MMRSKKGIIGSIFASIFSTIIIILILVLFILASFFVKFVNSPTEDRLVIVEGREAGLSNLKEYMVKEYKEALKIKLEEKLNEPKYLKNE